MKEADLFPPVKEYFTNRGYEVYGEVQIGSYGRRADMVAVHNSTVIVIELKTSLGLAVIEQARKWSGLATMVYVATPTAKQSDFVRQILKAEGLGSLTVSFGKYIHEGVRPKIWRHKGTRFDWAKHLHERQKEVVGGCVAGGQLTPYRIMIDEVKTALRVAGGGPIGISQLAHHHAVKAHYCNPRAGLYQALKNFENKDIELVIHNGKSAAKLRGTL